MDYPFKVGQRVQIPVHYDAWMRGARFGTVRGYRRAQPGVDAAILVRMDYMHRQPCVKVHSIDWDYLQPA